MCYAIPGRVVSLSKTIATVDYFGEERKVRRDVAALSVGDYVYAQGGVLVSRIPEREAVGILEAWRERFFELKEVDRRISAESAESKMSGNLLGILQKANLGKDLTKADLMVLLSSGGREETKLLSGAANALRQREHDNACCVHGIIEFSNFCTQDCIYCGIRKGSRKAKRYRMSEEEIVEAARHAAKDLSFKAIVLQSGEDPWYDDGKLERIVREVRKLDVLIFLSIGMRSHETYRKLYKAGARAALLRFETADPALFERMRPGTTLEARLKLIRDLRKMGYVIATGFLIGLPGETDEGLAESIMLSKSLEPDMHSFGPFIPAAGTPLSEERMQGPEKALRVTAAARLADRRSKILVTTALEVSGGREGTDAKRLGLLAGGNSLMIDVTPDRYRKLYTIYDGKAERAGASRPVEERIKETVELLYSLGRAPTDLGM
ncbi:MAG: radical SAM protein [Candidatus Aenigmatarchaeota archaeon]